MANQYLVTDVEDETLCDRVRAVMRSHNVAVNPAFMDALAEPKGDPRPLHVFALTDGEFIGGLLAETQFAWCKVGLIAVEEQHRTTGVGSELLRSAEAEARSRGCRYVYLDSMEYHAPDFYAARGYDCVGSINDWDSRGHTKYFFTKRLDPQRATSG